MHDGITSNSYVAYLLLVIGFDGNIKKVLTSSSVPSYSGPSEVYSVLMHAPGANFSAAREALLKELNHRASIMPLWAWFKHKLD